MAVDERTIRGWSSFDGERYLVLETYRRGGAAVATPVWFVEHDGALWVRTFANTGKLRRLRWDARVRVAPSDRRGAPTGAWRTARARIAQGEEARAANRLLNRTYGARKLFADLWYRMRLGASVVIEIREDSGRTWSRGQVWTPHTNERTAE